MKAKGFLMVALLCLSALLFSTKPLIGISVVGTEHDWDIQAFNGAKAKAKELGADVIAFDGERRPEKQLNDIKTLISRNVDAIIVILGYREVIEPELKVAREKGIKIVTADFQSEYSQCNVSTNNMVAEIELALQMISDLKCEGELGIFYVPGEPIEELRKKCLDLVLSEYPKVKIVAQEAEVAPGTIPDAYNKTKDMLRAHPEIDAFWAIYDQPMIGSAQAIADLGHPAKCYGFDGDPTALKMIADPTMPFEATVLQQPYKIGETTAEMAIALINGEEVPALKFIDHILVNSENIKEILEELKLK
ncbi:MAG TPA: substrate-binding domain-containing protein [Defluviitoga sp.]|nr:substrate-binding domain-containing protein [Defluviitoga sp.]HPZ74599.1 substrate-binding domain-containing protein [Candidatus Pacearchaeota archaeon]